MFKNLGIKVRIIAGFSIVVFLVCLVGFVGYTSLSTLTGNIDRVDDVDYLVRQIHQARQEEKNFMLNREHDTISLVEQHIQELHDRARIAQEKLTQSQEQEQMERVIALADTYLTRFRIYVGLTDQKDHIRQKMQSTSQRILEQTEAFRQDQEVRLVQTREDAATLRQEYKQKANDALQLFKWTVESEALRTTLMYEEEFELLAQWKALNHKITGLTVDLKSRLKTENDIARAGNDPGKF